MNSPSRSKSILSNTIAGCHARCVELKRSSNVRSIIPINVSFLAGIERRPITVVNYAESNAAKSRSYSSFTTETVTLPITPITI